MEDKHSISFTNKDSQDNFEKEEILTNFAESIQNVHCDILQSGINETEGTFYICECDPERRHPICSNCFLLCHKGGQEGLHKEIKSGTMTAVCICGYKCHKPLSESNAKNTSYQPICYFGEMGKIVDLNYFYLPKDEQSQAKKICLFCRNICFKTDPKMTRVQLPTAREFNCRCNHHNHSDIRIIFRKLKSLAKNKNFIKKYDFEGMSFIQFVNIFCTSKNSYSNLFKCFQEKILSINVKLKTHSYGFDDYNILNDLHLTCQILLIFSHKSKQEYKCKYIQNGPEKSIINLQGYKGVNETIAGLANKQVIRIRGRSLYYFNDVIKNTLTAEIYFKIMERKFDYKSRNIWQLKFFLTQIFCTFHISRDFASYPNFKTRDILQLTPLQRALLVSNIETEAKVSDYVNNLNMNYLDLTLNSIESIFGCEEKSVTLLLILARLYKICLLFAKYSLFNHEQVAKICSINDYILAYFDEEKSNPEKDFIKLKIVSPMIKTLVFLSIYYNDQIVVSALKGEMKVEDLNFFHGKTDICKAVTQNAILVLTFIQRFDEKALEKIRITIAEAYDKKLHTNIHNQIFNAVNDIRQQQRFGTNNTSSNNLRNNQKSETVKKIKDFLPEKSNHKRSLRNVIKHCNILIQLPLELNEYYNSGLVRLIDTNQEILFKYIRNQLHQNEREFVKRTRYLTEQLEDSYLASFKDINTKIYEEKFIEKYEDIIAEFEKNLVSTNDMNSMDKKMNNDQDNENLLFDDSLINSSNNQHDYLHNNSINVVNNDNNNQERNEGSLQFKKGNLFLLTKSFFLQSMMKYYQILYYNHIAKRNPPEEFQVKQSNLQHSIEMLYSFTRHNVDHCLYALQTDFTTCFELFNGKQLISCLEFIHSVLSTIATSKRDIPSNTNLLHLIKVATLKSANLDVLNQILKIMQLICSVSFTEEASVKKKMRKICKTIFANHVTIKGYFQSMSNRENDKLQCFKKETEKLIKKFMRIINRIFNEKEIIEEKEFLDQILGKEQLSIILYTKSINISLRTELLQFYRMNYIETIIDKKNINYFASLLINDLSLEKKDEIIENPKYHKFFDYIVKSGVYNAGTTIEQEANVIKFELLNFQEILTITTDKMKIKRYIEVVIKAILVFFSKFSSLIFDSSGYNCLSLYEMIYYFLELKKFIYARKEVFINIEEKKPQTVFLKKMTSIYNDETDLINQEYLMKEGIRKRMDSNIEKEINKKIKTKKIPKTDEERVYYDLRRLGDENFEFLNYPLLKNIFNNHTKKFLQLPKVKGFKEYFEKKTQMYPKDKVKKLESILKKQNKLNTPFDNLVFNTILKYLNMKATIDKSSFIKGLEENNTHFNTPFKMLLCKSIIFHLNEFEGKLHDQALWYLFRLLQYYTTDIQETFIEISENNNQESPLFDFNTIVGNFTSSVVSVFLREINPHSVPLRKEYYNAVMNLKIMKYFCEEHNQIFQTHFFNNVSTDQGSVIVYYKSHLKNIRNQRGTNTRLETIKEGGSFLSQVSSGDIARRMKRSVSVVSHGDNTAGTIYNRKASVFEYLLSVLGKIILLSKWINSKEEHPDEYFYDIYFGLLEFLIETIQGTSSENLSKVFSLERKSKDLFGKFLSEISMLMGDDNLTTKLHFQVRKDMTDFLMAFLEESATPSIGVIEISSVILPTTILESIISTMGNLYEEKTVTRSQNDIQLEKKSKNQQQIKRVYNFTPEMKRFFTTMYFKDDSLGNNDKFALANRMYQYFKMLGESTRFKNPFVSEFYYKMKMFTEAQVIKAHFNKKEKLINSVTKAEITDQRFINQYLCVSFFESITRTIYVNKIGEEKPVQVIFTINPVVLSLSTISKEDFIDYCPRTDRYTKLFCLMERCDNFFEEIRYKQHHGKSNFFMRLVTDINFYYVEIIAFCITLTINLIMVIILQGEGDVKYGDNKINFVLIDLGIVNMAFNALAVILWLISKYNLLYMTECQIMLKVYQRKQNEDEKENEIILTWKDKFKAGYIVLIEKNKLFVFFWNILFSAIGSFTQEYFLYILQLFIIFNLSQTLRNLLTSLTVKAKQLGAVFFCSVVFNLVHATIAFFRFEEDFTNEITQKMPHAYPPEFLFMKELVGAPFIEPAHLESECGTLIYCFATHLDHGMRFDGGIADRMMARSFNLSQTLYVARFFYEVSYFILQTVLFQGMIFGIVIEAFSELRNKEQKIESDKTDICFICGIDKEACEKNGQKFEDHIGKDHDLWTYVDYILGLRFIDIQETNAINSYVMEKIEKKELDWFPISKESLEGENGGGDD